MLLVFEQQATSEQVIYYYLYREVFCFGTLHGSLWKKEMSTECFQYFRSSSIKFISSHWNE